MSTDSRRRVRFVAPEEAEVVTEDIPPPAADQVRVRTRYSAISPGTERLVYQGQVPNDLAADASIEAFEGEDFSFPISYGYACVGVVEAVGTDVDPRWRDARVFAFQPHVSHFLATPDSLLRLPDDADLGDAVMIPFLETAVNLVMDGRPLIGEHVLAFGQGIVGLLTVRLLADFPLASLTAVDPSKSRRDLSASLGADSVVGALGSSDEISSTESPPPASSSASQAADLAYELSGQPSVLNDAIRHTCFDGRIVVGSWYGTKRSPLNLGERFHRSRIDIISSQVSTIAPSYRGRWTKDRRMSVVLDLLDDINPGQLVSDKFPLDAAPSVYERLVDDSSLLQPIFLHD